MEEKDAQKLMLDDLSRIGSPENGTRTALSFVNPLMTDNFERTAGYVSGGEQRE